MLFDDGRSKLLPLLPIDKPQFAHEAMGHGTIHNYPLSYSRAVGAQSDSKRWPVSPHASIATQFPDKLDHARAKQHGDLCLWRIGATVGLLQQRRKRQLLRRIWQSLLLGFCPLCSRLSDEIELRKLKPVWRRFISYASYLLFSFCFAWDFQQVGQVFLLVLRLLCVVQFFKTRDFRVSDTGKFGWRTKNNTRILMGFFFTNNNIDGISRKLDES